MNESFTLTVHYIVLEVFEIVVNTIQLFLLLVNMYFKYKLVYEYVQKEIHWINDYPYFAKEIMKTKYSTSRMQIIIILEYVQENSYIVFAFFHFTFLV